MELKQKMPQPAATSDLRLPPSAELSVLALLARTTRARAETPGRQMLR